jgi:hypothetical protein
MTYIIPSQQSRKHLQENRGANSGTIYQSRNISLDVDGYIKLADATYAVMTTDDDASLVYADAILASNALIFVNSQEVFSGTLGVAAFTNRTADTNKSTPGVEDDVVYFNETEVVSDADVIKYRSASTTWTTIASTSLTAGATTPTAMCVFEAENSLAIGKNNTVIFVNTSWTVNATRLTLPNEYQVSSMASRGSNLYIGTRSKSGREAKMFVIATIQAAADAAYGVGTHEISSLVPFKSSVVCVNSLGQLLRFTGGGFEELAVLPIYATKFDWGDASDDYATVANRSLSVDGDLIYVNLSSYVDSEKYKLLPGFHSGVWCYDSTNGSFYHRFSPSYTRIQTISGSNVTVNSTDDNFTLTSGNLNECVTGMPVMYRDTGGTIPELEESTVYYMIKSSSTVFKLATTYTNALAGTAINLTGTGNTANVYYVFKTNDYGFAFYGNRMSATVLNNQLYDSRYAGRVCLTADVFAKQDNTTVKTVINAISQYLPNRGYFVTPKLNSSELEDIYNSITIKYAPLKTDDSIIIKYKDRERIDYPKSSVYQDDSSTWDCTWTSTTTFTTTRNLSDLVVGDEVEFIAGVGSGHIAHVTTIAVNAGTYTITIDDAFTYAASGDKVYAVFDNWTKLKTITSATQTTTDYITIPLTRKSKFLQLKVEMRGVDVTVEELIAHSNVTKPLSV